MVNHNLPDLNVLDLDLLSIFETRLPPLIPKFFISNNDGDDPKGKLKVSKSQSNNVMRNANNKEHNREHNKTSSIGVDFVGRSNSSKAAEKSRKSQDKYRRVNSHKDFDQVKKVNNKERLSLVPKQSSIDDPTSTQCEKT